MNESGNHTSPIEDPAKPDSTVRREVLSLSPEEALARILGASEPKALIQSFPEEELYYLVHDIGPVDALPVLALASYDQWEFFLDMEVWEKDQVHSASITQWMALLMEADTSRFLYWFNQKKTRLLELFLFRNVEVKIRETDQDPAELGEGFFSLDDVFYVRIPDPGTDVDSDTEDPKVRETIVKRFLDKLAEADHVRYQQVLLEAASVLPAEVEEEAYRKRNVRLAEKGFLPFDEAIGVYQAMTKDDLFKAEKEAPSVPMGDSERLPVPVILADMLKEDNLFTASLKFIDAEDVLHPMQSEFASLCNRIIVADRRQIKSRAELTLVVRKASGYLAIGLEEMVSQDGEPNLSEAVDAIRTYPLSQIFRIGYGLALSLKWRVEGWRKGAWFENEKLPLNFWGEDWLGVLGGLLIKRPLYFDNYRTGVLYREFESRVDIDHTASIVSEIMSFDTLLSRMTLDLENRFKGFLTYQSLTLTLWARHCLKLSVRPDPISLEDFKIFFEQLFEPPTSEGIDSPRKIRDSMKETFLQWLADKSRTDRLALSRTHGEALDRLFGGIEGEYGHMDVDDLDPRFLLHFLVAHEDPGV